MIERVCTKTISDLRAEALARRSWSEDDLDEEKMSKEEFCKKFHFEEWEYEQLQKEMQEM